MPVSDKFIYKEIAGDYMLIPLTDSGIDMSCIYNINETAAIVYKYLKDDKSIDEIVEAMKSVYDVPAEVLKEDVTELVNDFIKRGIYYA